VDETGHTSLNAQIEEEIRIMIARYRRPGHGP